MHARRLFKTVPSTPNVRSSSCLNAQNSCPTLPALSTSSLPLLAPIYPTPSQRSTSRRRRQRERSRARVAERQPQKKRRRVDCCGARPNASVVGDHSCLIPYNSVVLHAQPSQLMPVAPFPTTSDDALQLFFRASQTTTPHRENKAKTISLQTSYLLP